MTVAPSRPLGGSSRRFGVLELALTVEAPLIVVGWLAWLTGRGRGGFGVDFEIFRRAAASLVHGRSPYVQPTVALLSENSHYVYPAPFAYLFAPFLLMPQRAGAIVFLLVSAIAIVGALRLLEVQDRRLYGVAILAAPVVDALGVGAIGPLLLLAVAAGWRLRGSPWSGVLLALAAAAKLFLWPLLVWLLVTRRLRASITAAVTLALIVAIWAAADPHGLVEYPRTLRALEVGHPSSYSARALWLSLGLPGSELVAPLVAVAGIGLMVRARDERAALAAAVAVALLSTPLLWLHYLVVLPLPLALYRPRLSWPWFVPLCLWVTPGHTPGGAAWRMALVLVAIGVTWGGAMSSRPGAPAPEGPDPQRAKGAIARATNSIRQPAATKM